MVIAKDTTPNHWVFYFQDSGFPLSVNESCLGSVCKAHIALQELQAVAMMLCRMAFWLLCKVQNVANAPCMKVQDVWLSLGRGYGCC